MTSKWPLASVWTVPLTTPPRVTASPPGCSSVTWPLTPYVGAGTLDGPVIDLYPEPRGPVAIELRRERMERLLGVAVPDRDVERILRGLGLGVLAGRAAVCRRVSPRKTVLPRAHRSLPWSSMPFRTLYASAGCV